MSSCMPSSSTVPISELVPDVLVILPMVPDVIIENALRRKAVEFSNRVRNLSCELRINTQSGVDGYPIDLPQGWVPRTIKDVNVCGVCYDAISKCSEPCRRGYIVAEDVRWITLTPPPMQDEFEGICLTVDYVLSMDSACDIPREYFDQYANTLVDGALSILFAMQGQEWTNRSAASEREREFRRGISEAREDIVSEKYSNTGVPLQGIPLLV